MDLSDAPCIAEYIFGDDYTQIKEDQLLAAELDQTNDTCADLIEKFNDYFDKEGLNHPDDYLIHVYGRNTGTIFRDQQSSFGRIFMLEGFQMFNIRGKDVFLSQGYSTPIFPMSYLPRVVKNQVVLKTKDGKATLKPNGYRSVALWVFWNETPTPSQTQHIDDKLQQTIDYIIGQPATN